jgi:hypothetical protein
MTRPNHVLKRTAAGRRGCNRRVSSPPSPSFGSIGVKPINEAMNQDNNGTMKYHHLGIPTTEKREGEVHLKHLKIYVSGYKESPYHIEWMRYEPDAPYPELVKTVSHVAFEVEDLEQELQGKKLIIAPNSPSPGVTVAFIEDNGAPVEFLQIDKTQVEDA